MLPSHTGTQQWQSFEFKMRRRRVERCLLRASVAIEAGVWEDAREALDEVARLEPGEPELARLSAALTIAESPPPEVVDDALPTRGPWLAVAASLVALSGAGGWWVAGAWVARPAETKPPTALTSSPAPLAADARPVAEISEPSVRVTETAISVPVTAAEPPNTPVATLGDAAALIRPSAGNVVTGPEVPRADAVEPRAAAPLPTDARLQVRPTTEREAAVIPAPGPGVDSVVTLPEPSAAAPAVATVAAPQPLTVAPDTVALAASSPASPPPAPPARPSAEADENRVRGALARYEAAYGRLDAAAARAVWPTVDQRALAHAFEGLDAQTVSLGRCDIRVTGPSAQASCVGSAKWTPKVGGGVQTATRQWRFTLQDTGSGWVITQANVR